MPVPEAILSNFIRAKGADVLVRATAIVHKQFPGAFTVRLVGENSDPGYLNELMCLAEELPESTIDILGPRYGADKMRLMAESDVFVLPTRNDCFPLSILEAMSAQLAVITTDEGAIADIVVDGVTGDIVDDLGPEAVAKAMIKHIEDSEYSYTCGQLGYTIKAFEARLTEVIDQLMNERNT